MTITPTEVCGKRAYPSKHKAMLALTRMRKRPKRQHGLDRLKCGMGAYQCGECGQWHLGHTRRRKG